MLEVEIATVDQLFALESITNLLVSDGLLIQDVAKIGRAVEVVENFKQGTSKYVA